MKKIILSAVAIFTLSVVSAQNVKFGVKAGLNSSTFTGDTDDDTKSKIGFNLGGFAEIKISDKFAVQPELLYSTQGAKFDEGSTTLGYINIPVMAKFFVAESLSLEAGPQIGFLTSAKSKFDGVSVDVKDELKSVDFGLNFGLGYDFTPNVYAGFRYNLGLSNIVDAKGDDDEIKNSVLSLSIGYKF